MVGKKYLIVNADDFGMSPGINRGIIKAQKYGIVTSASLLVRWPAAAEAALYGRRSGSLSLGLHVDLGEWGYRSGQWSPNYHIVNVNETKAVEKEIARQMAVFFKLVGKVPTHLDSHQHVHRQEPVRSILLKLANQLNIPLRFYSPKVQYCGKFYGQSAQGSPNPGVLTVSGLLTILKSLPPGYTELGCHPGEAIDVQTDYRIERLRELNILCNPQVRKYLSTLDLQLCSFSTIRTCLIKNSRMNGRRSSPCSPHSVSPNPPFLNC